MALIDFRAYADGARALKNTYKQFIMNDPNADYAVLTGGDSYGQTNGLVVDPNHDDHIVVPDVNFYLETRGGDDTVEEFGNKDLTVLLGDGDDTFIGNLNNTTGTATVLAGRGNDILVSTGDAVFGETGDDILWANGDFSDTMHGGSGKDVIFAGLGDDLVMGGSGNDTIDAGDGADQVDGNSGNDIIYTGKGMDTIYGGEGEDKILSYNPVTAPATAADAAESKFLHGGSGDDTILGGVGDDTIYGGPGEDVICLDHYSGHDEVYGFKGAGHADGDMLRLQINLNNSGIVDFQTLIANATDNGTDTTFDLGGGNTVVIKDHVVSDFSDDDFEFTNDFSDLF